MNILKEAWAKFDRGGALSKDELNRLIANMELGIEFLLNRGETGGALFKARLNLDTLLGFRQHIMGY